MRTEKEKKDEENEKEKDDDNVEKTDELVKEKDIVDDATVFEELTATISPITTTTSKDLSTSKHKKRSISNRTKILLGSTAVKKDREVSLVNVSKLIAKKFSTHEPKMIEELFRKHMHNTTLNLYPTTSSSTAEKSSAGLKHQLYLNMKSKPQDQVANLEI
ncbi:hypothetical protein Tco_1257431 [Tanacetum coccineum]